MPADSKITDQNSLLSKWLNRKRNPDAPKRSGARARKDRVPLSLDHTLAFFCSIVPESLFFISRRFRFKKKLYVESLVIV